MCVVSNMGDHYGQHPGYPWTPVPPTYPPHAPQEFRPVWDEWQRSLGERELTNLKKRVEALEELLRKAKDFDAETGQPDCELESKKDKLRKLAKELGVEVNFP